MPPVLILAALLAVAGVALLAVGVALWSVPAGLVVGGVELLAAASLLSAMAARAAQPGRRR
jgi:membrane protein implicated in regulation of membrane protease activity